MSMSRRRVYWLAAAVAVVMILACRPMHPRIRVVGDLSKSDVGEIRVIVAESYELSIAREASLRSLSRLYRQLSRRFRECGLEIRRTGQWSAEASTGTPDHGTRFIFQWRSTGWQLTEVSGIGKWDGIPLSNATNFCKLPTS